jgi:murein DD-endopeptidase MepM/ murein hydrolase activator NlpD
MRRKKKSSLLKRLLKTRKILIVSDTGVEYYPLGRGVQVLAALGAISFISWASYSTGSYMAAKSQIKEKDRQIEDIAEANRKIESEFALLKRDFSRVNNKEMAANANQDYEKFVIGQYEKDKLAGVKQLAYGKIEGHGRGLLYDRMSFLEKRVEELKKEKQDFVDAVYKVTKGRITNLQETIGMTGLNTNALERKEQQISSQEQMRDTAAHGESPSGPQGGPYIPLETSSLSEKEISVFEQIDRMNTLDRVVKKLPLGIPMKQGKYTSGFGSRMDPFTGHLARHMGIDFAGPQGSKVYSSASGKVSFSGWRGAYGNVVEISHGYGVTSRYAHLSNILVNEGQTVSKGQPVGIQGTTGRSTGLHLHYEVRYNDTPLNPSKFIKAGKYVSENK